ncbi:aminotransferase class I/II-fold pyridoxal phosphate-dependent enzyme [Rhodococcus hoagii]|nr:aminotransferase class I/II-fold pyridoxal phosphate-dependent enzyme [Prescottella equi]
MGTDNAALGWLDDVERREAGEGLRRELRARREIDRVVDLASNDYLGLVRHPRVDGAVDAVRRWGGGATGSRWSPARRDDHELLERELAPSWEPESRAGVRKRIRRQSRCSDRTFGSGCADRVGRRLSRLTRRCVPAVTGPRPSWAPHADVDFLRRALAERAEERALVLTDSCFQRDGDLAPLADMHRVCAESTAPSCSSTRRTASACAAAVVADSSRGGLAGEPDVVVTATLSKSLASQGGCGTRVAESPCTPDRRGTHVSSSTTGWRPPRWALPGRRCRCSGESRSGRPPSWTRARDLARITGPPTPSRPWCRWCCGDPRWRSRPRRPAGTAACTWAVSAHHRPGGHVAPASDGAGDDRFRRDGSHRIVLAEVLSERRAGVPA